RLCLDSVCRLRRRELPGGLVLERLARARPLSRLRAQTRPRPQRRLHAGGHARAPRRRGLGAGDVQHRLLLPTVLVGADHDPARRLVPAPDGGFGRRADRLWRGHRRRHLRRGRRLPARARVRVRNSVRPLRKFSHRRLHRHLAARRPAPAAGAAARGRHRIQPMKITEVRTRVVQWREAAAPLPPHFCTNPMDLVPFETGSGPSAAMSNFAFHGWVLVEVFTDAGLVGLGNAALAPLVTKTCIDTYLRPLLLGADPWDIEILWQRMYRRTLAFGRKGVGMVAISAVDIALWDLLGKAARQPVFRLLGGRTKARIPVYASRLYSMPLEALRREAQRYRDEGYTAMKLRFGWGPVDGAAGMQRNLELVRTVREVVGDGVDLMADAYMGWTLDYAKRMLP